MAQTKYYSEDVLIEKMQAGEMDWLDYVNHYSGLARRVHAVLPKHGRRNQQHDRRSICGLQGQTT